MVQQDLPDQEIIELFMEAGLEDDEIRDAISSLKTRSVEEVYRYLEEYKNARIKKDQEAEENRKKSAIKHKEMLKKQELIKKNQLQRVKERIKACQEENRRKDAEFDDKTQKGYDDVEVEGEFKARIYVPEKNKSLWLGFPSNATTKDFFEKIAEKFQGNFKISIYSTGEEITENGQMLSEIFPHKATMFELNGTLFSMSNK